MTAKDNRLFVEAVRYRYRAGVPWRDLPKRLATFGLCALAPFPLEQGRSRGVRLQSLVARPGQRIRDDRLDRRKSPPAQLRGKRGNCKSKPSDEAEEV